MISPTKENFLNMMYDFDDMWDDIIGSVSKYKNHIKIEP